MATLGSNLSRVAAAARQSMKLKKGKSAADDDDDDVGNWKLPVATAAESLARDWELERAKLVDFKELGEGNFGLVYLATAKNVFPDKPELKVAVKTLQGAESSDNLKEFMQEAGIMKAIDGPHHIVRLLGLCTKEKPFYMVMELMPRGDLLGVLRKGRPTVARPSPLSIMHFGRMAADIAEGMAYLASVSIVHRDLATRNCLVADDYTVKVGDFGLTRKTYSRDYYRMKGSAALPIRWLAPECLEDGFFSASSDLWAYGVTLWEVVTMGKTPYPEMSNQEVFEKVCEDGYRPWISRQQLGRYRLMSSCWQSKPAARGTFDEKLKNVLAVLPSLPCDPIDVNTFSNAAEAAKKPASDAYSKLKPGATAPSYDLLFARDSADEEVDDADELGYTRFDPTYKPVPLPISSHYALPADALAPKSILKSAKLTPAADPVAGTLNT